MPKIFIFVLAFLILLASIVLGFFNYRREVSQKSIPLQSPLTMPSPAQTLEPTTTPRDGITTPEKCNPVVNPCLPNSCDYDPLKCEQLKKE